MNTSKDNTDTPDSTNVVVPAEKKQTIILGKKEFPVNKEGCVDLNGVQIPKISLSDLPEEIIYEICTDYFLIQFNPGVKPNIDFMAWSDLSTPPYLITFRGQGEIFRQSIRIARKKYPSIRQIYLHSTDYELTVRFSAHVEGKTLQEVFNSAKIIADEVLKPIDDIFQIVDQQIQELKKKSKK